MEIMCRVVELTLVYPACIVLTTQWRHFTHSDHHMRMLDEYWVGQCSVSIVTSVLRSLNVLFPSHHMEQSHSLSTYWWCCTVLEPDHIYLISSLVIWTCCFQSPYLIYMKEKCWGSTRIHYYHYQVSIFIFLI